MPREWVVLAARRERLDITQVVAPARDDVPDTAARVVHVAVEPRDDVHVKMRHGLARGRARVEADVEAVGCSSSSSCFFTESIRSRIAALSASVAENQSATTRRVTMRVCPGETGKRSRIANASSFEATQLLSGTSRNTDTARLVQLRCSARLRYSMISHFRPS